MRAWLSIVAVVASCTAREPEGPPAQRAFYYWRTTFALSAAEQRALGELHVDRLYVRVFDIEWDAAQNAPALIGKLTGRAPAGIDVVPVIFLRNEVFQHPTGDLARTAWAEVERRAQAVGFAPHELQLDCDWTDATRDAYFDFVRRMRAASGLALSATIRLHQVKYRERTGVPPVDRGMLMFYNMGRFSADPEARAIFDTASAERYLARIHDYPLPLDAALPIWSWTLHVRDDRVEGLMQSTDPDELASIPFVERIADDRYRVTRSAFLHGTLLREDDVLKVEVTGPAETMAAAKLLAPTLAAAPRTISLFDLSERNVTRHGTPDLDQVFRAIR